MSDYAFMEATILIQPYADAMGPFTFDLAGQIPSGGAISAVTVKSYLEGDDTTAVLIDSSSELANVVSVYFNYPGAAYHGNHKLTFQYTLATGAKDEADFWCVKVTNA